MATQWLYLSIVILLYVSYKFIFFLKTNKFNFVFNYSLLSFYFLLLFSFFSIFVSSNLSESFIDFSKLILILGILFVFISILQNVNLSVSHIFKFLALLLLIENIYFFTKLYLLFSQNGRVDYRGITSNINIQSFSILLKLPFLFYAYYYNYISRFFNFLISVLSISIVLIISSRSSLAVLSIFIIFYSIISIREQSFKKLYSFLFSLLVSSLFTFLYVLPSISANSKIASISLINQSTISRLNFYQEAISTIFNYPLFGIGIGNWKIYGIFTHKDLLSSYTTPYHVHNDFLQFGAETGILGMISFICFIIFPVLYIYKMRFNIHFKNLFLPIGFALFVYISDSFFNFPISRPIIQVQFLFIIAMVFYFYHKNDKPLFFKRYSLFFCIILVLPLILSSYKLYDSYVKQGYLMSDFDSQKFDTPLNIINSIDDSYPNITATALPIKALKANYYSSDSIVSRLLDLSIKDNPYIKYPQALKAIRFYAEKEYDSAIYYARDSYNGIRNNELHILTYMTTLASIKDSITLDSIFEASKSLNSKNMWAGYLSNLLLMNAPFSNHKYSKFKEAIKLYPNDPKFEFYRSAYFLGDSLRDTTKKLLNNASVEFNNKNYAKSAEIYLQASRFDPIDPSYLENAGHSLYLLNDKSKAKMLFDSVITYYPNTKGKAYYFKGLMLIESKSSLEESCRMFSISLKRGYSDAQKAINLFCK